MNTNRGILRLARTGGALAALLVFDAHAADLTLYADDDYQGRALSVVIDQRQLGVMNFDDRTSSVVVERGSWTLCTGEDYRDQCISLEVGRYPSLGALGLDDAITSVRRQEPTSIGDFRGADAVLQAAGADAASVVLYAGNGYSGGSRGIEAPQARLETAPFHGAAISAVIARGEWSLCSDADFKGECVRLGPGKYPSLESYGLERGAASVRPADAPRTPK
jgi:hypothetical protein